MWPSSLIEKYKTYLPALASALQFQKSLFLCCLGWAICAVSWTCPLQHERSHPLPLWLSRKPKLHWTLTLPALSKVNLEYMDCKSPYKMGVCTSNYWEPLSPETRHSQFIAVANWLGINFHTLCIGLISLGANAMPNDQLWQWFLEI